MVDLGRAPSSSPASSTPTPTSTAPWREACPARRSRPGSFVEILERIWWRLDRALDEETVYLSGLVGAIEAALSGATLRGGPPRLAVRHSRVARRAAARGRGGGLRSVLCYEVTDRNGHEGRDLGLEESRGFLSGRPHPPHPGDGRRPRELHALGGEPGAAGAPSWKTPGSRLHIHVAEDRADVEDCRGRYGVGLVERLQRHGLLRPVHAPRPRRSPRARRDRGGPGLGAPGSSTTPART